GTRYVIGWGVAAAIFGLFMTVGGYQMLVGLATNIIATNYPPEMHSQAVDAFTERAQSNASNAVLGAWRSFFFVALAAAAMWAFVTNRLAQRTAAWALVAILIVDLWSIER